jgi:hypothetical protein
VVGACAGIIASLDGAPAGLESAPHLFALEPGYDSPLLHAFTVHPDRWDRAVAIFLESGQRLRPIGRVVPARGVSLVHDGREKSIEPFWDDQNRSQGLLEAWFEFLATFLSAAR